MTELPRFDFSQCAIKDDEELEKALAASQGQSKFFSPGRYDVTIEEVTYNGLNKKDESWGNLEVVYKGAGEKTIKDYLLIPFKSVDFGEKKTKFPFLKVRQFCAALGVEVKGSNLEESMKSVFGRVEKLKG